MKSNAYLAVALGLVLAVAETALNWGHWQWWPYFVVDYVASALLIWGGLSYLRIEGNARAVVILTSGWAFTSGMAWMAFAMVTEAPLAGNETAGPVATAGPDIFVFLVVLLLAVSIGGFLSALFAGRNISSGSCQQ